MAVLMIVISESHPTFQITLAGLFEDRVIEMIRTLVCSLQILLEATGGRQGGKDFSMRLVILAMAMLFVAAACGSSGSEFERELVDTRWRVVEMAGFPEDNVASGSFSFGADRFGCLDGFNDAWSKVQWNAEGFEFEKGGFSTAVLPHDGPRSYLADFPEVGSTVRVVISVDGSLTMTCDDLVVVGVREE